MVVATTGPTVTSQVTGAPYVCGEKNDNACDTDADTQTNSASSTTNGIKTTTTTTTRITYVRGNAPGKTCGSSNNSCTLTPTTTVTVSTEVKSKFYWATLKAGASNTCSDANYDVVYDPATLTDAQKQNYVNWWSYYRTRLLTMKTAAGRVFDSINATRFRVGYSTIHETGYSDSNNGFLAVRDFDAQKTTFFSKLYAQSADNGTPLRPALEKAGRYFAGVQMNGNALPSGTDPVQYSCQRNYTILSTDGYWNNNSGDEDNFRSSYSPKRLSSSTDIGNQDDSASGLQRPMLDDGKQQGGNWVTGGAGKSNTLADIAAYFYATHLRTSSCTMDNEDVCVNNVVPVGNDTASHQHMTTYTVGLGVSGKLTFQSNYDDSTLTSGDFYAIRTGARAWPDPMAQEGPERIDDLWHAAVNGRGRYYSASNAGDLVTGLTDALEQVQSRNGTGAAAATSTLQPVAGNSIFLATYTTELWEGNVKALSINPSSGAMSTTAAWEAKNTLLAQVGTSTDSRSIDFFNASATDKLSSFTYANLNAAGKGAYFANVCQSGNYKLSQCGALAATNSAVVASANDGTNFVNYLRGQTGYEDKVANATATARLFRGRATPLGDIVNAAPVYVKKPPFKYTDAGYSSFVSSNASRAGVVYVAANGGMLHAFSASTGAELWAYVPSMVMPEMYRLADNNYAGNHRFYVDGAPVVADVHDGTNWRTILIGGLNAGGRGYYALDVTTPSAPKALWEITNSTDNDIGLSFGNPIVTKNKVGTWVVAFTSGYNNVSPGTGNGYLFVRNAVTGAAISKIPTYTSGTTPAGDTTTPSNLGKIAAWLDLESNNTAARLYAGDMLGNLWRFDFDDNLDPSGSETMLLAQMRTSSGAPQPITIKPQVFTIPGASNVKAVSVGTGRLLGAGDFGDSTVQSIYVFKDSLSATPLGVLRSNTGMVQQSMVAATANGQNVRQVSSPQALDWTSQNGWYMDLSLTPAGERVTVDMVQSGSSLIVGGNIPTATPCTPGGSSWQYVFNLTTGGITDSVTGDAMIAGFNLVKIGSGLKVIKWNIRGDPDPREVPPIQTPGTSPLKRSAWRELIE